MCKTMASERGRNRAGSAPLRAPPPVAASVCLAPNKTPQEGSHTSTAPACCLVLSLHGAQDGEVVASKFHGTFLRDEGRVFFDQSKKSLAESTRKPLPTYSSLILDDCNQREGVKEGKKTWVDHANCWVIEPFSHYLEAVRYTFDH